MSKRKEDGSVVPDSSVVSTTYAPHLQVKDFFQREPVIQNTWENTVEYIAVPRTAFTQKKATFEIPQGTMGDYQCMYVGDAKLQLVVKIADKDGNPPPKSFDTALIPIDCFPQMLIRSVGFTVQNTPVGSIEDGGYNLNAFTYNLLGNGCNRRYGASEMNGAYISSGGTQQSLHLDFSENFRRMELFATWFAKKPGVQTVDEDTDEEEEVSGGDFQKKRKKVTTKYGWKYKNESVAFYADVLTDFSSTDLPLPPRCAVRYEFEFNKPNFYFLAESPADAEQYMLYIEDINLIIPTRDLAPPLMRKLLESMKSSPLTYRMRHTDVIKRVIPSGETSFLVSDLKLGETTPDRIIACFVPVSSWDGELKTNPLDFQCHWGLGEDAFHLTSCDLTLRDISLEQEPVPRLCQFHLSAFRRLYKYMGQENENSEMFINRKDFKYGNFFLMWDLTQDRRAYDTSSRHPTQKGYLKLHVKFNKRTTVPMYIMIMREFHSILRLNHDRRVVYQETA